MTLALSRTIRLAKQIMVAVSLLLTAAAHANATGNKNQQVGDTDRLAVVADIISTGPTWSEALKRLKLPGDLRLSLLSYANEHGLSGVKTPTFVVSGNTVQFMGSVNPETTFTLESFPKAHLKFGDRVASLDGPFEAVIANIRRALREEVSSSQWWRQLLPFASAESLQDDIVFGAGAAGVAAEAEDLSPAEAMAYWHKRGIDGTCKDSKLTKITTPNWVFEFSQVGTGVRVARHPIDSRGAVSNNNVCEYTFSANYERKVSEAGNCSGYVSKEGSLALMKLGGSLPINFMNKCCKENCAPTAAEPGVGSQPSNKAQ